MRVQIKKLVKNPKYQDNYTPTEPKMLEQLFEGEVVTFGLGQVYHGDQRSGAYILLDDGSVIFEELFNIKKLE